MLLPVDMIPYMKLYADSVELPSRGGGGGTDSRLQFIITPIMFCCVFVGARALSFPSINAILDLLKPGGES